MSDIGDLMDEGKLQLVIDEHNVNFSQIIQACEDQMQLCTEDPQGNQAAICWLDEPNSDVFCRLSALTKTLLLYVSSQHLTQTLTGETSMSDHKKEMDEAETWGRNLTADEHTKRGPEHLRAKMKAASKKLISIRMDEDIIDRLKELAGDDGSYQRLLNQAVREWLDGRRMEDVLRQALREEFEAQGKKSA